jgi:phosphomevalonate kinase
MTSASASAPGKILLCGEYVVLAGAPAIVTAVDCRALVVVETIPGVEYLLTAPGMVDEALRFRREASGSYRWPGDRYRLVEEVLEACPGLTATALSMHLDTQSFRDPQTGRKLGLGSSAALATALVAALDALFHAELDVQAIAAVAHRNYQSGKGSGADIAASFAGGTIRFQKSGAQQNDVPRVQPIGWPAGLEYRVLWSGRASDTETKLQQLEARKAMESKSADALAASATTVADLWDTSSADAVLGALRAFVADLRHFSADQEIGIFDGGHQQLVAPAESLELVYKPCGAGGGDIGMVFGTSASALNAFCEYASSSGFSCLDTMVATRGVSIEPGNDA